MQSFPKTAKEILSASLGTKEAAMHDIPEEKKKLNRLKDRVISHRCYVIQDSTTLPAHK